MYRRIEWTIRLEYRTSSNQLRYITQEIKRYLFENENFDISVVKNDYYSAFVEFVCDYDKKKEEVMKLVDTIKGEEGIEKIITVKEFYENVKKEISF